MTTAAHMMPAQYTHRHITPQQPQPAQTQGVHRHLNSGGYITATTTNTAGGITNWVSRFLTAHQHD